MARKDKTPRAPLRSHLPDAPAPVIPSQALVASARRLTAERIQRADFTHKAWQQEAWAHYDAIGELRYASRYESSAIGRARLVAARLSDDPHGSPEPLPPEHPASQIMSQFMGGRERQASGLERMASQLYIAGVSYLVAYEEGGVQHWHVCATEEIRTEGDRVTLMLSDAPLQDSSGGNKELPLSSTIIVRVWNSHPRRWWEPDSAVRGVLPILRELDGLTKHVGASIDSRLAGAGLLVLPQEMTFTSNADDLEDDQDPFVAELIKAMTMPIQDRDSAAAVVPLVIKVPGQHIEGIKHLRFSTEFDAQTHDLREETIRRLALGLDIPAEILLGVGDVNHWTAWQIEESSVKMHIEPKLQTICSGITSAFLHPALEAMGEETEGIICWYDTTALKLRPNRGEDAQNLHDNLLITDAARRKASGFAEEDAPGADDKFLMTLENVIINSPQLSLELLPIYARLIGADVEGLEELIRAIQDRVGIDGEPDEGPSNGANPSDQDDSATPGTEGDGSDAAASIHNPTDLVNHAGNIVVPNGTVPRVRGH